MEYRRLGKSGLKVSIIGLGTNQFGGTVDQEDAKNIMDASLDLGINLIDTANVYQEGRSEEYIGAAIKNQRDRFVIATKFRHPMGEKGPNDGGTSRQHIIQAVHDSLARLDTDYIDLYQIHSWSDDTPLEETLRALDDLVREGKVRYIGVSNFNAWQTALAASLAAQHGWEHIASNQPHYHLLTREVEAELLPACDYFGVGILPYFPLAGGFLTGKYKEGQPAPEGSRGERSPYVKRYMIAENYAILEKLAAFAAEHEHTVGELAHSWLLAHPAVSSVISGATKLEHVQANAKAADWELTPEDFKAVQNILDPQEDEEN